jgi:hypothetical protein
MSVEKILAFIKSSIHTYSIECMPRKGIMGWQMSAGAMSHGLNFFTFRTAQTKATQHKNFGLHSLWLKATSPGTHSTNFNSGFNIQ